MTDLTLMGLWARHKRQCRPVGDIVADARARKLPGVELLESGFGHRVVNEQQALDAMRKAS